MFYKHNTAPISIIALVFVFAIAVNTTLARENYFSSASGDISKTYVGAEKVVVTEDGGFSVLNREMNILSGYPKFIPDSVVASSPVLANMSGDVYDEIIFVARNSSNEYSLYVYNGDGSVFSSKNLGLDEIYYDPMRLKLTSTTDAILLPNIAGEVSKYEYANNTITESLLFNFSKPVAISASPDGKEIIATFPNENYFEVYSLNGGNWTKTQTVSVGSPIVFPFRYNDDSSIVYATDKNNNLIGFTRADWKIANGLPVAIQKTAISSPVLANTDDAHAGKEISVPVSDGTLSQISSEDSSALGSYGKQRLANAQTFAKTGQNSLARSVGGYSIEILNKVTTAINSVLSRIKIILNEPSLSLELSNNATLLNLGDKFVFTATPIGETKTEKFVIANRTDAVIELVGNPSLKITGDNASEFNVVKNPVNILNVGESTEFEISFAPTSGGTKNATLTIENNQPNNPFVILLEGQLNIMSGDLLADNTNGVPPMETKFSVNISGGAATKAPDKVNFSAKPILNLWPNVQNITFLEDDGATLKIDKFGMAGVSFPYVITQNTVVEFDFKSDGEGWEHAIGFEQFWNYGHKSFALYGWANYPSSINDYHNYTTPGEWKHYKIPIGQHFTGITDKIVFSSYCNNAWCPAVFNSYFKNVQVYESNKPYYTYSWDFGDGTTLPASVANDVVSHIYNKSGNFTAKVTIDDTKTIVTKEVGISTTWDQLSASLSVSPQSGALPLNTKFSINSSGGAATKAPDKVNFSTKTLSNLWFTSQTATVTTEDAGATLKVDKFGFVGIDFPYTITPNTVVEFDFKSDGEGWEHAIGFEQFWNYGHKSFALYGWANYPSSINDYHNYTTPGEWKHYKIPIGNHFTGITDKIYFTSYCNNAWCPAVFNSYFKNVQVYESNKPYYTYSWDFGDGTTLPASVAYDEVEHTYSTAGNYNAKVIVNDGESSIEKTGSVAVDEPAPAPPSEPPSSP